MKLHIVQWLVKFWTYRRFKRRYGKLVFEELNKPEKKFEMLYKHVYGPTVGWRARIERSQHLDDKNEDMIDGW